jgi:membrane-associated protease RseP (regulator of RpoE activity)
VNEVKAQASPWGRIGIPLLLFASTLVTTALAGAHLAARSPDELLSWDGIFRGLAYAGPLLGILLAHEAAHSWAARHHRVPVSLPYFIPAPPDPFLIGTFGAFLRIQGRVTDRNALLDIGVAGPIAGLVVALPVLFVGLALSEVKPLPEGVPSLQEGDSLLYLIAKWTVVGDIPPGHDVMLHPAAFAGWLGLFVTCLNLIPVGSLDGGHIAYALLGDRARLASQFVPLGLAVLGLFGWGGWLVWAALSLLLGMAPTPLERFGPLDQRRLYLGALAGVLLIATFVPLPLQVTGVPVSSTGCAPAPP